MKNHESIVRKHLCKLLNWPLDEASNIALTDSLADEIGLTSLDMIVLVAAICRETGLPMTEFDESDIAKLNTPNDILMMLSSKNITGVL